MIPELTGVQVCDPRAVQRIGIAYGRGQRTDLATVCRIPRRRNRPGVVTRHRRTSCDSRPAEQLPGAVQPFPQPGIGIGQRQIGVRWALFHQRVEGRCNAEVQRIQHRGRREVTGCESLTTGMPLATVLVDVDRQLGSLRHSGEALLD